MGNYPVSNYPFIRCKKDTGFNEFKKAASTEDKENNKKLDDKKDE